MGPYGYRDRLSGRYCATRSQNPEYADHDVCRRKALRSCIQQRNSRYYSGDAKCGNPIFGSDSLLFRPDLFYVQFAMLFAGCRGSVRNRLILIVLLKLKRQQFLVHQRTTSTYEEIASTASAARLRSSSQHMSQSRARKTGLVARSAIQATTSKGSPRKSVGNRRTTSISKIYHWPKRIRSARPA